MKAMIMTDYGSPEVFAEAELAKPEVKAGHVVVRIAATSVNPVDMKMRELGRDLPISPEPPAVLGMDFAGTIEEVGEGVTAFAIGDEVYGCAGGLLELQGALAEYMLADAKLIAHKPKNLSMREAAALPLVTITAYEGLQRAGVKAGQKVLVHGGTGGVGHIALQLALHSGAEVYATAGSDDKLEIIKKFGATPINYKTETVDGYVANYTDGTGFDVVFDSVGAENIISSMEAVKLNGHIATTVSMVEIDLTLAHVKGLSLHVVFMLLPMIYGQGREAHGQLLAEVADIIEAGELALLLDDNRYTLSEVAAAHTRLASGEATGKVVVEVA